MAKVGRCGDRRSAAIAALLVAAMLAGQTEPAPATVEGVVKNLRTGEALADVRVTLTPEVPPTTPRTATTDAEGKFTVTGVPPGRYTVAAARTLFFRPRRSTGITSVTLAAGDRLRDLQILLMPTGVISGRAVDENREPVRSVRIEALRNEYRDGILGWVVAGQYTTDDRGEYRLFNLQPGAYLVRAGQSVGINAAPMLYYPGVPDSESASSVRVEAGGEVSAIDILLRRGREFTVQFKLGGVPPGSTATFIVQRRNSKVTEPQLGRPDPLPDSTYRLTRMSPGAYDMFVQVSSPPQVQPRILTHAGRIPLDIGNADEDLGTIAAPPTVSVHGKIVATEALPAPLDPSRLVLTLRSFEVPAVNASVRGATNPPGFADDGSFTMPNVPAGRYQISLTGLPANTYLISARAGAREVLDSGFSVNGSQDPLEVRLGGAGSVATVSGSVVNARGEAVPAATVVLVPSMERRGNPAAFKTASADQSGNFVIRQLLAGEYRVFAWEDVEAGAAMDPAFLKDYETRGEPVRADRGSSNAVTVRVIPAPN